MRIYRALLRLLPLEFRDRFGRELEGVYRSQRRDAAADGPAGRLRLWLETLWGLVLVAPREHLSILRQDLVISWRMMRRRPALSVAAVTILAVALGATTAMFSVVSAVLLRPLPYRQPQDLVVVGERERDGTPADVAPPVFVEWAAQARQVSHIAAVSQSSLTLKETAGETMVDGLAVTSGFFDVYGVVPALGRLLTPAPPQGPKPDEAVLSHDYWMRRFAGDPRAVGQVLPFSTGPALIVGVLQKDFRSRYTSDVFVPLVFEADNLAPPFFGARYLRLAGRLKPGVEPAAAEAELASISTRVRAAAGRKNEASGAYVQRLHDALVEHHRGTLWLMFGTVTLVLVVAGINVSSLLLARAVAREEELAIRAALGASAARLFRQVLTESLVLSTLASAGGLIVAALVLNPLVARLPPGLPTLNEIRLDWRVCAFAAGSALALGTLLGLAPAARVSARRLFHLLTTAGRQTSPTESTLARRALLSLEVAATFVLLVASVLMAQHFLAIQRKDLGFSPDNVVTAFVSLHESNARYSTPDKVRVFAERLIAESRNVHGVTAAGLDCNPPLGYMSMNFGYELIDRPAPKGDRMSAQYHCVGGRAFAAYGTRILEGRAFDDGDQRGGGRQVAIVNVWMARKYWPGGSAIGRLIKVASRNGLVTREIVGVAANRHHKALVEPEGAEVYVPFAGDPWNNITLAVRVDGARDTAPARVREVFARVDPALEVLQVNWMSDDVAALLAPVRFQTLLLGSLALIALVLAVICIHGVTSYAVSLRTREMGVRIALGASASRVIRLVIFDALRPIAAGLALGGATVLGLSRLLRLDVAGLNVAGAGTTDPLVVGLAACIMLSVAMAAIWLPARRATRVDPLTALRQA